MANPPGNIDVLLTEGPNLGSDKPAKTEDELELDFLEFVRADQGTHLRLLVGSEYQPHDYDLSGSQMYWQDAYH